jgi:uncharacterized protein YndB with AHSA1/START domain
MTLLRSEPGVTRSVDLDAAPAAVWDALTEAALLTEWLADEVEIEPEPGGEIVCRYADGSERRGEVELVEEAERLSWSWWREGDEGPSRVELVLDAVAAGTRLTVIETAPLEAPSGPLLIAGAAGPLTGLAVGPLRAEPAGPPPSATWAASLGRLQAAVRPVLA